MPVVARKLRVEYAGAIYHVMNRGDRREPIFQDEADRQRFVETLGEGCERSGWQVHAYCLMPNHFHLVVETPQPTLVAGMKWFLGTYTGRFNRRHKLFGHLFSSRYKSLIVDGSGSGYLRTVCEYVLRTFITSYFWPNCYRKNPANPARAIVRIRAVVRFARATT